MNTAFVEAIGDLFTQSFAILRFLGNGFNALIAVIMFILAVIWIKKMGDFNREAEQNGTLK
jgi:flagellar biogenesis protein FliO